MLQCSFLGDLKDLCIEWWAEVKRFSKFFMELTDSSDSVL